MNLCLENWDWRKSNTLLVRYGIENKMKWHFPNHFQGTSKLLGTVLVFAEEVEPEMVFNFVDEVTSRVIDRVTWRTH